MVEARPGEAAVPTPGRPRVVLVTAAFPVLSETFLVTKFRGLVDLGWDVRVATGERHAALFPRFRRIDARRFRDRVHVSPPHRPRILATALLPWVVLRCLVRAPGATTRYLRRGRRRFGAGVLRRLYLDAAVVELDPDLVHFEFGALAPDRMHLADLLGCPVTVSFRGYDIDIVGVDDPGHYDAVWAAATRVHVLGAAVLARARARGLPDDVPVQPISPAIDLAQFAPVPRRPGALGTPDRPLRLVAVGRSEWRKGHETLLRAVRMLRDRGLAVEGLCLCGGGPRLGSLGFARHQMGLEDCVELLGAVPQGTVRAALDDADVFVHPAMAEGFGNAVIEAQASGLPVVCSDAGGLPENVVDGLTGTVVPRADAGALADALADLAADGDRRLSLGAAGAARALDAFGLGPHLEAWEAFYRSAIEAGPSTGRG